MLSALTLAALLLFPAADVAQSAPGQEAQKFEFDLTIKLNADDTSPTPLRWRILRGPKELNHVPTAAWIERPQVKRGKWRPWPAGQMEASIKLFPQPEVAEYDWRVVVYVQNDMREFRIASEAFREVAIGASEAFAIPHANGSHTVEIERKPLIRIMPQFGGVEPASSTGFSYVFSYGPHGRPPRYARGDWDGRGFLPIQLSPFAEGRRATLELDWHTQPAPWKVGPEEFKLAALNTKLDLGQLPQLGEIQATYPDPGPWQTTLGFLNQQQQTDVREVDRLDSSQDLEVSGLRYGEYFLLATGPTNEQGPLRPATLRAHFRLDEEAQTVTWSSPAELTSWDLNFDLWTPNPDQLDELQIRTMFGPFLWQVTQLTAAQLTSDDPQQPPSVELPTGDGFHYVAMARGKAEDGETTVYHWFGEGQVEEQRLSFALNPTMMEIDGYEDGANYTLRLFRDPHGPKFPPPRWMTEALAANGVDYLPFPFVNTIRIFGLPEGAYEASMWGYDRESDGIAELSYHYPVAD